MELPRIFNVNLRLTWAKQRAPKCYLRNRWSHCIQTRCANLLFTMNWFSAIIILHGPNSLSFRFSYLRAHITLRNMSDMCYNLVIFDPTFRYSPNTHHPVHVWVRAQQSLGCWHPTWRTMELDHHPPLCIWALLEGHHQKPQNLLGQWARTQVFLGGL